MSRPPSGHTPLRVASLLVMLAGGLLASDLAQAWSLTIGAATRRVFLHVGNGTYDANNPTINLVQVSVPAAQLGNGAPLAMTSNSTQSASLLDGYITCPNPAQQVLIGASYRRSNAANGPASATLSVTSPANLTNAAGDTIPFSQISWTVSAAGSGIPAVIPAGTFTDGTQVLTTVPANTYIENCHSFRFANSAIRAAGTYTGQVRYTISTP
ncbi:MAG TPA: hypothetical protein PKC60_13705 [Hydrogenophaga sp.]|uniref:hypothetical protein n=1 Tax=Hydrogenophaga sp. TaxID=1904254 RepID=UPI002C693EF9|nr:hypothetical protein [Hydrogenophaga sp.]HMN94281.1 hypothetical protein [Hydrogenophaga sp.]HMP11007.1 hypothetical protein [Hydrogenophaga sp.]